MTAPPSRFPEWPALLAVMIWASLAAISGDALTRIEPAPLLLVALGAAAAAFFASERVRGTPWVSLYAPRARDVLLCVYGLGGYHALLFLSFQRAPLIEANLLNDTWPLLTVVMAAPIAQERLTGRAVLGAVLGLFGTVLVVAGDLAKARPSATSIVGYALALAAALVWSSFTNLLKVWPPRNGAMAMAAFVSALLCGAWMLAYGDPLPRGAGLGAALYLGAFPLGVAILFWELGVRQGRVMVVGALSYLTPLLATLCVWIFLGKPLHASTAVGGALILAGAVVGTWRTSPS